MKAACTEARPPALYLNQNRLRELRKAHGIRSEADLARRIGVNAATLWRVVTNDTPPSNRFMARMLLAFPTVPFEKLFEVRQ